MGGIDQATGEQSDGIVDIVDGVRGLDGITQSNAAMASEVAESTGQSTSRIRSMAELLGRFRI
jgi:methyl-accepting chemotaxis protein